jgi:hypothetical protein
MVVGVNWIYSIIYSSGLSLAGLIMSDKSLTREERDRIGVIYIVGFFVIFFWACFEQAGSSLTYIADHQTDTHIFGWEMPPTLVQNANSLFIIIFAPLFSLIWIGLAKRKREPISPVKQSLGLLLLALGYLIIASQVKGLGGAKLGVIWLIVMYLFHTLGELCLSPIGLSLVSKLAPIRFSSLLMGVFFLSNASGYALAGTLGALYPPDVEVLKTFDAPNFKYIMVPAHDTVPEVSAMINNDSAYIVDKFKDAADYYAGDFDKVLPAGQKDSALTLKAGNPTWSYDTSWVKKKDKDGKINDKDSSLVLHTLKNHYAANSFSIPIFKFNQVTKILETKPVAEDPKNQPKVDSLWLADASSRREKFTFSADGKTFAVWSQGKVTLWDLNPPPRSFAGFKIHNLFEFFMVFVCLPGVASIILFLISGRLGKMMHGVR